MDTLVCRCAFLVVLILITEVSGRPGFGLCKFENKTSYTDAYCNGKGNHQTLSKEKFPLDVYRLYVSNFIFQNLSMETFPPLLNVTKFYAKENDIWHMEDNTFLYFSSLNEVSISNCTIKNITQIFQAISSVKVNVTLSIEWMRLTNLNDKQPLMHGDANLTNLTLGGNDISELDTRLFARLNRLQHLSVVRNSISHFSANNSQLKGVKTLDLQNNRLNASTARFCLENGKSLFPNLLILNVGYNSISVITNSTFLGLQHLKVLDLTHNDISNLDIASMAHLISLQRLVLKQNWIQTFSGLTPGNFPPKLTYLDLKDNQISPFLPALCSNGSATKNKLVTLNLRYNRIRRITSNNTSCLVNLKRLYLRKNAIKEIQNNAFTHLKSLRVLKIDNQLFGVQNISDYAFNLSHLVLLDLQKNFMLLNDRKFENIFFSSPHLKKLHLSDNQVNNITGLLKLITPLKNLTFLKLERVGLEKFPFEILSRLQTLRSIHLDQNNIKLLSLPPSSQFSTSIKYLSISYNTLHFRHKLLLPQPIMSSLKFLNIGHNLFDCSCSEISRWLRYQIKEVPSGTFFQNVKLLDWPDSYKCHFPQDMAGTLLRDYRRTEEDCKIPNKLIPVYIYFASSCFVVTVIASIAFWKRWYILYYLHKFKKSCKRKMAANPELTHLLNHDEETYDAYVIYSENDGGFVLGDFRKLVEEQLNFKLHIWDRDGSIGNARSDSYFDAIEASRHVLIIVSDNIFKDAWCEFQINIALMRNVETEGRKKMFLVILSNLNVESMKKSGCSLLAKTSSGKWCETENEIRQKVFTQDIKATLSH
ncbi:insulin-like growth factor-binding protein complex acid labile subunit [Mya arenaria]|uniref:insulin-like growth factor-binding protein complex acid labile subunit n=1 Tax=Mya arenaria TaxID=6604 RepID=UPI0022E806C9|nr:insulin-like growth factor-binding protein complex acid labile subunit [Mya arenaria]